MVDCRSGIAGATTPIFDFGTGSANHNVFFADYQNGIEIRNFNVVTTGGTDLLSLSGVGKLVVASSCDGGTINLRGIWEIIDNSGGAVTFNYDDLHAEVEAIDAAIAVVDTNVDGIKTKTDSMTFTKANELDSNLQSVNGVTITGDGSASPFDV